ncbi:MAG: ROK family transcriptional regulator, partial [Brachybacterium sp.]|nr:ROK family transcriptional regulator [Brachybacterium sp.]
MQGDENTGSDIAAEGDPVVSDLVVSDLGGESTRAVYRDLLRFGPRSRSELSQRLRMSAPTVTRVTRDLLERDLLHPLTAVPRAKGRPHEPLDVEEDRGPRFIGVKVTADEVHAVVTTVRATVLEELVLPLESTAPEHLLETILVAVEAMIAAHPKVVGIGVG